MQSVKGNWARQRTIPYAGAAKWGTGIDPVHARYGSDNLRIAGRNQIQPHVTPPSEASPEFLETHDPWGYQAEDLAGLDQYADPVQAVHGQPYYPDDWPDWSEETTQTRASVPSGAYHPWGSPGWFITALRSRYSGARTDGFRQSSQLPTETVSEGWRNKARGSLADAEPPADSQVFVQTSMTQRYETRNNKLAVNRNTDDSRHPIDSRTAGQKLKIYSGETRHYDMFPYQQNEILRPFRYRTAGTGNPADMEPNALTQATALQRTPPPDPSIGTPEIELSADTDGYTNEDLGYY